MIGLLNANALHIPLASDGLQVIPACIFLAMNPGVALVAQRHNVGEIKSKSRISRPGLYMMSVDSAPNLLTRTTSDTLVVISFVDLPNNFFPVGRSIRPLTLRGASVNIVRIETSVSSKHPVEYSAQIRLWFCRLFFQYFLCLFGVSLSKERVNGFGIFHVVIRAGQVLPAWARGYAEVYQLFIDALRVAPHNFTDVVSGQFFNNVFLIKPVTV